MPVLKLDHEKDFYLLKISSKDKAFFESQENKNLAGNTLKLMNVQPFNINPHQKIVHASIEANAAGKQELILSAERFEPEAPSSAEGVVEVVCDDINAPRRKKPNLMKTPVKIVEKSMEAWSPFKGTDASAADVNFVNLDDDLGCTALDIDNNNNNASRFLKVEGLPNTPHFEAVFDHDFNAQISQFHSDYFVRHIQYIGNNTAIVEMSDAEAAEDVLGLNFEFEGKQLQLSRHEPAPQPTEPSREVLVTGVPGPFCEQFKLYFEERLKMHMALGGIPGDFRVGEYCADNSSVIVEFENAAAATKFCNFNTVNRFIYRHSRPVCEQQLQGKSAPRSCKVLFENVVPPFSEVTLRKGLNFILDKTGGWKSSNKERFMLFEGYDAVNKSVVVKFESPDAALEVVNGLKKFEYNYELVSTCMFDSEEFSNPQSCCVELSNVHPPFCPANMKKGLLKSLISHFALSEHEDPVVEFQEYKNNSHSVIVEMESLEMAQYLALLEGDFYYNYEKVAFKICEGAKPTKVPPPPLHDGTPQLREDWPYYESAELLKLCTTHRDIIKNSRHKQYKATWLQIQDAMNALDIMKSLNQRYSVESMKKRLRSILKWKKTCGQKWPLKEYVMEYLGEKEIGTSIAPDACRPQFPGAQVKDSQGLRKKSVYGVYVMDGYNGRAVLNDLSYEKDLLLIAQYKKRQSRFEDRQTKSATLYAEIANHFSNLGYHDMTADKCSDRMGELSDQFKRRYDQVRNKQTGIGDKPMNWTYWDQMSQLFEDSAVLEPSKLISLGTSNTIQIRSKKPSLSLSKNEMEREFIEEMKRFNDNFEKEVASNKKHDSH